MRFVFSAFVFASSLLIACDAGSVLEQNGSDGGGIQPPITGDSGLGSDADLININCQEAPEGLPSGEHNPGTACQDCHGEGGTPPIMTASGTLYRSKDGAEASPGGVVVVLDANGDEIIMTSAQNGNFWTTEELTLPLINTANNCENSRQMLDESIGDCNSCHSAGNRIF